jgi:hypothetical protein
MNPAGKSFVCILHEFVQHAERVQPKYTFQELGKKLFLRLFLKFINLSFKLVFNRKRESALQRNRYYQWY